MYDYEDIIDIFRLKNIFIIIIIFLTRWLEFCSSLFIIIRIELELLKLYRREQLDDFYYYLFYFGTVRVLVRYKSSLFFNKIQRRKRFSRLFNIYYYYEVEDRRTRNHYYIIIIIIIREKKTHTQQHTKKIKKMKNIIWSNFVSSIINKSTLRGIFDFLSHYFI